MESYKITKVEEGPKDVIFSPSIDGNIDEVFNALIDVDEEDVIYRENCKLCNHRLRFETERKWEEIDNFTQTAKWLNDQIDEYNDYQEDEDKEGYFSVMNVRTHMKSHYKEQERQIRLRDYSKKIEALVNIKQDRKHLLDVALAVCFENLSKIASIETGDNIKSEKSRSDAINKIMSTIISVIELQTKIDGEISSIDMVQEKFVNTWIDVINKERSDAKKQILIEMLEQFSGGSGK